MSGTSLDGLDVALVEIEGTGLDLRVRFVSGRSVSLGQVGAFLRGFSQSVPASAKVISEANHEFARLHVDAIRDIVGDATVDLISVHGQTVYHAPPMSWQLLAPFPIAHEFRCPVVYDLRQGDLAAGGQGAPLSPLADSILLRDQPGAWAVVNLGGFVNVTRGPDLSAEDVCPCNLWLDTLARTYLERDYDEAGFTAAQGSVNLEVLAILRAKIEDLSAEQRSLGTGDEVLPNLPETPVADLLRTVIEAISEQVKAKVIGAKQVFVAGGGAKNLTLLSTLSQNLPVRSYDEIGVPGTFREAAAWATLGALAQDGVRIALPAVTGGAPGVVAGSWVHLVNGRLTES